MDDLIAFLRACLDEDERAASAAEPGPWTAFGDPGQGVTVGPEDFGIASDYTGQNRPSYEHIARHDPARVLAEVAAKRQIIKTHPQMKAGDPFEKQEGYCCQTCSVETNGSTGESYGDWPCRTLRLLALPYADHPDYRPEWSPVDG